KSYGRFLPSQPRLRLTRPRPITRGEKIFVCSCFLNSFFGRPNLDERLLAPNLEIMLKHVNRSVCLVTHTINSICRSTHAQMMRSMPSSVTRDVKAQRGYECVHKRTDTQLQGR